MSSRRTWLLLITVAVAGTSCVARTIPGPALPPPQWSGVSSQCLALSGGGLRSGAVATGALQELQAAGGLGRFSYISSVSGGGYPVYGLVDRLIKGNSNLDTLLAEGGAHIRRIDENAGFAGGIWSNIAVSPVKVLTWIISSVSAVGSEQANYSTDIHGTFAGPAGGVLRSPPLSKASGLRHYGMPALIFGASAKFGKSPRSSDAPYSAGDYFELAADSSGSPNHGYYPQLATKLDLSHVIAISGAAIDSPQGGLPDFLKSVNIGLGMRVSLDSPEGRRRVYLSDAGFVENLGILPLLRRGCREVLAFDNSHDPDAKFEAWANFVGKAAAEGWLLEKELSPQDGTADGVEANAWLLPSHIWRGSLRRGSSAVAVKLVKLGIDSSKLVDYPETVRDFARKSWALRPDSTCRGSGIARRCWFPQETTVRQNYSTKELRAYRHLGRCLARRAVRSATSCAF